MLFKGKRTIDLGTIYHYYDTTLQLEVHTTASMFQERLLERQHNKQVADWDTQTKLTGLIIKHKVAPPADINNLYCASNVP